MYIWFTFTNLNKYSVIYGFSNQSVCIREVKRTRATYMQYTKGLKTVEITCFDYDLPKISPGR